MWRSADAPRRAAICSWFPWRRRALFGTWESSEVCRPDQASPTEAEVASFITELNEAFPALDLKRSDVGARPSRRRARRRDIERRRAGRATSRFATMPATASRGCSQRRGGQVHDRTRRGRAGRRSRAENAARHARRPCRTASTPLPGGHVRDAALTIADARRDYDRFVPSDTIPHLVAAYGSGYREVMELAAHAGPSGATRLAADSPVDRRRSWSGRRVTRWPKRCAMRSSGARRSARSDIPATRPPRAAASWARNAGGARRGRASEPETLRRLLRRRKE